MDKGCWTFDKVVEDRSLGQTALSSLGFETFSRPGSDFVQVALAECFTIPRCKIWTSKDTGRTDTKHRYIGGSSSLITWRWWLTTKLGKFSARVRVVQHYSPRLGEFSAGVRIIKYQGSASSLLGLELYSTIATIQLVRMSFYQSNNLPWLFH